MRNLGKHTHQTLKLEKKSAIFEQKQCVRNSFMSYKFDIKKSTTVPEMKNERSRLYELIIALFGNEIENQVLLQKMVKDVIKTLRTPFQKNNTDSATEAMKKDDLEGCFKAIFALHNLNIMTIWNKPIIARRQHLEQSLMNWA